MPFKIKLWGGAIDAPPVDNAEWYEVDILGLNYEKKPAGEVVQAQLGGYIAPRNTERNITLNCMPIAFSSWFAFVDKLAEITTKPYIYIKNVDYPELFDTISIFRIVPNGEPTIEHTYDDGTKSYQVGLWIYE